ncbi:MAG: hypothetical protein KKI07_03165 [Euryarchaeota archaeon]|nr:hypothetical protein [Euryarchaeota archaeon]
MASQSVGWIAVLILLFSLVSPVATVSFFGEYLSTGTPLDVMLSTDPLRLEEMYQADLDKYGQPMATLGVIFYFISFAVPLIGVGAALLNKKKLYYLAGSLSLVFAISMCVSISYVAGQSYMGFVRPGLAVYLAFGAGIAFLYAGSQVKKLYY